MAVYYSLCLVVLKYGCASSVYAKKLLACCYMWLRGKTSLVDGVLLLTYRNMNNLKNP